MGKLYDSYGRFIGTVGDMEFETETYTHASLTTKQDCTLTIPLEDAEQFAQTLIEFDRKYVSKKMDLSNSYVTGSDFNPLNTNFNWNRKERRTAAAKARRKKVRSKKR